MTQNMFILSETNYALNGWLRRCTILLKDEWAGCHNPWLHDRCKTCYMNLFFNVACFLTETWYHNVILVRYITTPAADRNILREHSSEIFSALILSGSWVRMNHPACRSHVRLQNVTNVYIEFRMIQNSYSYRFNMI